MDPQDIASVARRAKLFIKTYENRRGDQRVEIICSRDFALDLAQGSQEQCEVMEAELKSALVTPAEEGTVSTDPHGGVDNLRESSRQALEEGRLPWQS